MLIANLGKILEEKYVTEKLTACNWLSLISSYPITIDNII